MLQLYLFESMFCKHRKLLYIIIFLSRGILGFFSFLGLVVSLLVSMSFFTLIEQKILGSRQIRQGPCETGHLGLLQPFADAIKLYTRGRSGEGENRLMIIVNSSFYLVLCLVIWLFLPLSSGFCTSYGLLSILLVIGCSSLPLLLISWYRGCKYRVLGGLRLVSQLISYEVSCAFLFMSVAVLITNLCIISPGTLRESFLLAGLPLALAFVPSFLAENMRSPFDFREGESELVSGFNTELGGGGFAFCFMGEYVSIIFVGVLFFYFFFLKRVGRCLFLSRLYCMLLVFVRCLLPRFRYDKLMDFCWKFILPLSLFRYYYYRRVCFTKL